MCWPNARARRLLARDLLVAKQQDALREEGAVDLVELGVAERLGEIDARDLGADCMGKRAHGKRHPEILAAGRPRKLRSSPPDRHDFTIRGPAAAAPRVAQHLLDRASTS